MAIFAFCSLYILPDPALLSTALANALCFLKHCGRYIRFAETELTDQHFGTGTSRSEPPAAMHPVKESARAWYYEAQGAWNLLGRDENAPREELLAPDSNEGHLRMVAGAGFEPATFGL